MTEQQIAPDGYQRTGMLVNGAFPGPTIEANWGDWIEVVVHNNLENEGTSLHWHGLLQTQTPWFDGVPSVQQCPIAPGSSFTYRFRADLYGSSFWHSHYSAQYTDGIFGAMIIYGPHDNADYDIDLGPVLLTDYYHTEYYTLIEQVMAPASEGLLPPLSSNNLINGKMNYPCATNSSTCTPNAGISKFYVESGKTYRLRLINGGAEGE
jgi:FtsP/CotA-like multicopper oxidase with cupredoxin domain